MLLQPDLFMVIMKISVATTLHYPNKLFLSSKVAMTLPQTKILVATIADMVIVYLATN